MTAIAVLASAIATANPTRADETSSYGDSVTDSRPPARTAGLLLLLTPLIWGGTFPAAKVALEHLSPWTFMAWSRGLGLAALVPILAVWRPPRSAWRPWLWAVGVGLGSLMNLGYALQTVGIAHTTATDAGFITVLYVVFAPLGAAVLARRLPSPVTVLCVAMSFAGLALLSLQGAHLESGDGLVLGSAVAFACHILLIDRLLRRFDSIALATAQTAGSALVALLVAVPGGAHAGRVASLWAIFLLTGVLGSGVAFAIQVVGQAAVSPARAAVMLAAEALVSALTAAVWLGERLSARAWLGVVLMLAAIAVSETHAYRSATRAKAVL
jgi:drug/metabolite transporter (DMT)-like permease